TVMAETKFTPGPWTYDPPAKAGAGFIAITSKNEGWHVADIFPFGTKADRVSLEESIANAHLIVAAPDLYEVAVDADEILNVVLAEREEAQGEEDEVLRDLIARFRAAR